MTKPRHSEASRLLDRLESYEQLHVVVRVATDPGGRWTVERLAEGQDGVDVDSIVDDLVDDGVLARHPDGSVALAADPRLAEAAAGLLRSWREDPLPILQALTDRAMERLRSATARTFADAFVVRRKG